MTPREWFGRGFIILAGVVALGAILACPKVPVPPPAGPTDADAAPAATCTAGCANAIAVCSTVDRPTCLDNCGRIGPAFASRLAIATDCAGVKAADPGAPASQTGVPGPLGR